MIKLKDLLNEEKPGLWANIRAKKARGEAPAHGNSDAHKDAVKAGKEINKEATLTEKKYYVTYNLGRGRGKDLEKEFDQKTFKSTNKPKVFNSYSDAKKYAEKMEKMFRNSIGGGTAYWVSDEKMNPIKESVNEAAMNPVKKVVNAILKKHGVNAMKTTSTSVKGFHNIQNGGYRYDSDYFLSFYKVPQDIVKKVGAELEKAGVRGVEVKNGMISADFSKTGMVKRESVKEAKAPYEVYHKSYTSAIEAAREYAEKKGFEIDNDDSFRKIGMGPRKPSEGKTNSFSIQLSKDGKLQRKQLHIQVYGMKNSYELNAYIG
jgi:hypothetical protein